ncbi:MAG: DUF1307 domain-containing protein [Streptococcus sp.]|nr:DUF1307 domain-containing protein [Streptococcus sp.]
MTKKKHFFKLFLYSLTSLMIIITLTACSGAHKKAYYQRISKEDKIDSRITLEYSGDKLLKNTAENIVYYDSSSKELIEENLKEYSKSISGIKGVVHKIEYKDGYIKEKLSVDYSKTDIKELQEKGLIAIQNDQKIKYISLKETVNDLKKSKYSEVKDGKFKELE